MADPALEALPDFSTHPVYRRIFDALTPGGQNREQATLLLANFWHKRLNDIPPQQRHPRHLPEEGGQQQRPVKLEQGSPGCVTMLNNRATFTRRTNGLLQTTGANTTDMRHALSHLGHTSPPKIYLLERLRTKAGLYLTRQTSEPCSCPPLI